MNVHSLILSVITLYKRATNRQLIVGKHTHIYPSTFFSTRFNKTGGISIGSNCRIGTFNSGYKIGWFRPTRISARGQGASISIGNYARLNGINIFARQSVTIGDNAEIGSGVIITDINGHLTYSTDRTTGEDTPNPIIIGNNVWIGFNAIILKGTHIGDHSIVSAGSVVKGEFPPYSLISGNPAKLVFKLDRNRFKSYIDNTLPKELGG